jgi:hypothetical protein
VTDHAILIAADGMRGIECCYSSDNPPCDDIQPDDGQNNSGDDT